MTKQELIAKFNPANAQNLTEDDILAMRALTNEDLKVLAEAYPNAAQRKPYLVLHDANLPAAKQLRNLSTWKNLYNVRAMSNQKNLSAYTFRELWEAERVRRNPRKMAQKAPQAARPVQVDLSADEAAALLRGAMKKVDGDKAPPPPPPLPGAPKPPAVNKGAKGAVVKDLGGKTAKGTTKPAAGKTMQAKTVDLAQHPGGKAAKTTVAPDPQTSDVPDDQQEQTFE